MNIRGTVSKGVAAQIGARIRELRRQRNLTQAELAKRLGIRPGPMSAIERGRHIPSGALLIRLAAVLDVSYDSILVRETKSGYVISSSAEKDSSAFSIPGAVLLPPLKTDDPGEAGVGLCDELARAVLALEDMCGAMKQAMLPLHLPFVADEDGIASLTERVRHHLGVQHAVVFDYLELVENAGLRILFADLPNKCESMVCLDHRNRNVFIFVRNHMNAERQLFRLLFELGRVYWHANRRSPSEPTDKAGDEKVFAQKFAALFLMPEEAVRATVRQLGINKNAWTYELLLRIKHRFGISAETFCYRLNELGLIRPSLCEEHAARIKAHYAAHDFQEPDGSLRKLMPNGRVGDLLLNARGKQGAESETLQIAAVFRNYGVRTDRVLEKAVAGKNATSSRKSGFTRRESNAKP